MAEGNKGQGVNELMGLDWNAVKLIGFSIVITLKPVMERVLQLPNVEKS